LRKRKRKGKLIHHTKGGLFGWEKAAPEEGNPHGLPLTKRSLSNAVILNGCGVFVGGKGGMTY